MTDTDTASTTPRTTPRATPAETQADALYRIAELLDTHPHIQPLSNNPLWVFARDRESAIAWRAFLGNPPTTVDDASAYRVRCEATIGGLRIILAIADDIALAEPTPRPAVQVAEWLR